MAVILKITNHALLERERSDILAYKLIVLSAVPHSFLAVLGFSLHNLINLQVSYS